MRTSTALWKSIGLLAYWLISSTQQAQAATVTEGITSFDFDQDVDTLSMTTGTGTVNEPPRVTLKPHLPPGHEQGRIKNLHPVDKGHHYYTPEGAILDPEIPSLFARANITYQRPAVVLPHSSLVRYTRCLMDGIKIGFESDMAYDYVEQHWPLYLDAPHLTPRGNAEGFAQTLKDSNNQTGFLLISESLHCDASESGLHSYWHVSALEFDHETKTVSATAVEVGVDGAFDDVALVWGTTHPDDDEDALKQGHFSSGSLGPSLSAGSDDRKGGPGSFEKRQQVDKSKAIVLPWYSNIPQANLTTVQWNTVQATPQYYITPPSGTVWSPADRFTVLTLQSNTTSNTTGTLVYGYGGLSANQIQPQPHYALTSPSRELAPGYSLPAMQPASCGVRLVTYVYKEPATGATVVPRPNTREAFDVVKYAANAGLGKSIAVNILTVMNGPAAASCTSPVTTTPAPPVITRTTYSAPITTSVTLETKPIATGCANPPSNYKGLLTSKCGDNFDVMLDDRLGYFDFQGDAVAALKAWAPNLSSGLKKRSRRGHGVGRIARRFNLIDAIAGGVKAGVNGLVEVGTSIGNKVVDLVKEAEKTFTDLKDVVVNTLNQQISQSFSEAFDYSLPLGGPKLPEWKNKNALTLYQNSQRPAEAIYCVDCGVDGNAIMSGAIGFRVLPPNLSAANVKIGGRFHAGIGLGLTPNSTFTKEISKRVVTVPVPKAYIKIADLFTGGLVLTVDAVAGLELKTSGQVTLGMDLYVDKFDATIDLVGGKSGASGFKPRVEKRFEVDGPLSLSLSLAAPTQFGLVLEVPPLKWARKAGIRNTPMIRGTAIYQDPSCDGIKYDLDIEDRIDAEHFGEVTKLVSVELNDIISGCYVPPGWVKPKPPTPSSPTTSTGPTTPTSPTTPSGLPSGAGIKVAPSSPKTQREFYDWALFPGFSFAGMMPTLRGPFTTIEACAQRCLEEKDGCVAVGRYGTQCSLYYTDRPNGATLQLAGSTADATGLYLGSCEEVQAALPFAVYADAHAKCQRFYPKVQTSPDSPENAGEISKSWCAVTGASLPVAGQLSTWDVTGQPGKNLQDCWAECVNREWDCRAVGFDPVTSKCKWAFGVRGTMTGLELLAAKSTFRTLIGVPCEKMFIYSDQALPGNRNFNLNLLTPARYFPRSRDHLGVASDSPLAFGVFEASEFSNAVFSSAPTEISAGGSVNADSLSKCTSGCLSNAACQAVSWTRQSQGVKNICRFYKAPDWGNQIVGTVELHTAKVVIMGRCENVAHYLHPNDSRGPSRCVRYYPITNRPQGTLKRRADPLPSIPTLKLPGAIMETPEIAAALVKSVEPPTANTAQRLISLVDLSGAFALAPAKDGSLYLSYAGQAASYKFGALANAMVYGDGANSAFWYYPNTMQVKDTLGISRLRFGDVNKVPKTSRQVTLVSIDADKNPRTPGTYVAVANGQAYFIAICSIDNRQTKTFLVKDPVAGLAQLQAPESQYTVTGGPTSKCVMAVLQSPDFGGV